MIEVKVVLDDVLLNILLHMRRRLLRWRLLTPEEKIDAVQVIDSIECAVKKIDGKHLAQDWSRLHKLDVVRKDGDDASKYVDTLSKCRASLVGADISKLEQVFGLGCCC